MQANYANALCHLNATPLSVAVLAPCAWGENLACGVAWQSVVNSTKQAQRIQCGKCLWAKQRTATRQIWLGKCGEMGGACGQSENGAVFGRGPSLSLSLSRCSHFWHAFGLNLKGFSTYFIVVFSHLFAYKRHFLGHCVFVKFLNALFLSFLRLSLIAVFVKTADFVILSVTKNPYFKVQICTLNLWILHQKLSITKFRASLEF